jgi:hypothetical protein
MSYRRAQRDQRSARLPAEALAEGCLNAWDILRLREQPQEQPENGKVASGSLCMRVEL